MISGFLITALAIGEIERTGSLSIGAFWGRRARRLLPALYLLVAAVVVWALVDGVADGLGRDVVATLAYVANWVRVGDGYEYFAAYEQPSLLEHTWSLAVEEQFYLVWPVIVVLDSERTGWSGLPLGTLWIVVTAVLVAGSWFLVERPAPLPTMIRPSLGAAYGGVAVALAVVAVGITSIERSGDTIVVAATPTAGEVTTPDGTSDVAVADPPPPTPPPSLPTRATATSEPGPEPETTAARRLPPDDRPLRMMVLGDSVAESLKQPEPVDVGGVDVEVINSSIIACPVTWEGRWAFDDGQLVGDPPECDDDDRFAVDVAAVDPDLIVLMFGWPGTIAGRELDDGTVVVPCEPEFDEQFTGELQRLVDRFEPQAPVVVATVAPPTEYRDPAQSGRPECLNGAIRDGDFPVFEFGDWLCPGGDCTPSLPLRRDAVHFADSPDVRAFVWPTIIERVLRAGGY